MGFSPSPSASPLLPQEERHFPASLAARCGHVLGDKILVINELRQDIKLLEMSLKRRNVFLIRLSVPSVS